MARPLRLLPDDQPLSPANGNPRGEPIANHEAYKRSLHDLFQRQAEAFRPFIPGVVQGDPRRPLGSYHFLEKGGWKPLKKELTEVIPFDLRKKSRYLLCASCGNRITKISERTEIHGAHHHTFANPHGIIYHIGCFLTAFGCIAQDEESTQFSWFPGYSWQIELCRTCGAHLGWRFRSENKCFHGLILERLFEEHESRET